MADSTTKDKTLTHFPSKYIDIESIADSTYTDSPGIVVTIQNSGPKGGGNIDGKRGYTDSTGKFYAYAIFWTRVINKTATPLELTINFPADSFAIFPSPDSYLKLFLPPDTMTLDKQSLYNYGITGLKSFLDTGFNKPTMLQRTIDPNEECLFYVAALTYQAGGRPRAGFFLKEHDLFYRFSLGAMIGGSLIPCGQMVF
jgi:hypothetical protein